ncbi:MAG: KpsF/GutQ family sugar-phosphate isomerase [Pseudomonadota bacterium]
MLTNTAQRSDKDLIGSILRTLDLEIEGLKRLRETAGNGLGAALLATIDLIAKAPGRVIVTGMGKSGHVGTKLAATFASTGTPAFFVHPSEASHGDLGMIAPDDVIVALSWSGETAELRNLIDYSRRFRVGLVAITSNRDSALARASDVVINLPKADEACPHGLAPTTSTVMQLAIGDALAIALLERKGFSARDFGVFHPGGQLGANLKFIADVMHGADRLPLIASGGVMSEALVIMTERAFGSVGVTDRDGQLIGVITDGDLRRHMSDTLLTATVDTIMTRSPKTVAPDTLVSTALETLNTVQITALFVVKDDRPVGIVHIHDLLRAGVA